MSFWHFFAAKNCASIKSMHIFNANNGIIQRVITLCRAVSRDHRNSELFMSIK